MKKLIRLVLCLLCTLLPPTLFAQEDIFVPLELEIEGLQRVTLARLLSITDLRRGRPVSDEGVAQAIKAIYATGYFSDVNILRADERLIIRVVERPMVASLEFKGNKLIKEDQLTEAMTQNGIEVGRIFPHGRFELILKELRALYAEQGRYGVKIQTDVQEIDGNRIDLMIDIDEGKPTQIAQINLLGNQFFADAELRSLFLLRQRTKWNAHSAKSKYARQKFLADLETLRNHYLDAGFAKIQIQDTVVSIDDTKKYITMGIYIEEGQRYTLGDIQIAGNLVIPESAIRAVLTIERGAIFSQGMITESIKAITTALGDEGYGLARVNTVYQYDDEAARVDLILYVRPGQRTYIRRIQFEGNAKTQHTALRRILPQLEGAYYSSALISLSLTRLRRLPYLQNVVVNTQPVAGRADLVDLNFVVTETPSGAIGGGLIYNDLTGVSLALDFSDRNFLGSGNSFSTSLSYSTIEQRFSIRYSQPYVTLDGLSISYFLNIRATNFDEANIGNYALQSSSFGTNFGYPISESGRFSYGFNFDIINLALGSNPSQEVHNYSTTYGRYYRDFGLSFTHSVNTLNRGFKPTAGSRTTSTLNFKFPFATEDDRYENRPPYYVLDLRYRTYFKLSDTIDELAIMLATRVNYLDLLQEDGFIPFYAHYYAGGVQTVRGYLSNSLGPRATTPAGHPSSSSQGGNFRPTATAEFIFPIRGVTNDITSLRTSLFWDIGNVFNTRCIIEAPHCQIPIAYNQLRQSAGVTLRWYLQFLPLTFIYAVPLNAQPEDSTVDFQFTIGTVF